MKLYYCFICNSHFKYEFVTSNPIGKEDTLHYCPVCGWFSESNENLHSTELDSDNKNLDDLPIG